jgi:hypothetical protein
VSGGLGRGNAEVLAAIAAITGQSDASIEAAFHDAKGSRSDQQDASSEEVQHVVSRVRTRLGIAPAVDRDDLQSHLFALDSLSEDPVPVVAKSDLTAWDVLLRNLSEKIPTVDRDPVELPQMPAHQSALWTTFMELDASESPPWALVGGQMVTLHLVENGVTSYRPTDDGDMVVGVWTRRDALTAAAKFLRDRDFTEVETSDGYGYRYQRDKTVIDVMIPEGLERQRSFPKTTTGRPGLSTSGGNQALARAERIPITIGGITGYVRRPTLLGAIVVKAHAWVADTREPERHAQDIVALAGVALNDPRAVIEQSSHDDRKAIRRAMRTLPSDHRAFRLSDDPSAVHAFLTRLGEQPQ